MAVVGAQAERFVEAAGELVGAVDFAVALMYRVVVVLLLVVMLLKAVVVMVGYDVSAVEDAKHLHSVVVERVGFELLVVERRY